MKTGRRVDRKRIMADEFHSFVHERYGALVRFGWLLTGSRVGGEQLALAALADGWRRWESVRLGGAEQQIRKGMLGIELSGWWRRPVAAVGAAFGGRRRRTAAGVASSGVGTSGPGVSEAGPADFDPMWVALGGLPKRQRAILVLRYAEQLPDELIGTILGGSPRRLDADRRAALDALSAAVPGAAVPNAAVLNSDALNSDVPNAGGA